MPPPPPNAYPPGTKLTVGSHKINITKYISAGGFALVYTCQIDPPFNGATSGCLKRVAVPNKWQLNLLRQEVDAMKRLRGNPTIVSYIDSHASRLGSGDGPVAQQYEVFLLMEYCSNNGLIDFMNTRLTNKLTEPEILVIMRDITLGVAMCHNLQPPLLHRDIKIENVLIDDKGTYKLCDFGSSVGYIPAPKSEKDLKSVLDDIMQHTTPQYRAPEMIDLSRGFPIDDKLDIWALGCFLYKLCYYTTPFERSSHTTLQHLESLILHCSSSLRIPHNQPGLMFSGRLKNIIRCCLREDPRRRPNAVQLLAEVCSMMNSPVPNVIPLSIKEKHHDIHKSSSSATISTSTPTPTPGPGPVSSSVSNNSSSQTEPNRKITPKSNDPFASIDTSKFLKNSTRTSSRPKSTYGTPTLPQRSSSNNRPKSFYQESYESRSVLPVTMPSSSSNLKDYIQQQLSKSSENLSNSRKSEEMAPTKEDNTLFFLRDMEDESKSGVSLRQNTGGSFLMIKNGLRKISTGNSSTGTSEISTSNKRSSISSIKQMMSGNRKHSDSPEDLVDNPPDTNDNKPKKLSIQKRMAQLFNNDEQDYKKTAQGYGRFTENDNDDLAAINSPTTGTKSNNHLKPPKVPQSLSSNSSKSRSISPRMNINKPDLSKLKPPAVNPVAKKPPPPKPKKPVYLRTPENDLKLERRLSDSSEISIPDVDDLEKQFAKRFPSYV